MNKMQRGNIEKECVRVAAYEHVPLGDYEIQTPRQIINSNLQMYSKAVHAASKQVCHSLYGDMDNMSPDDHYHTHVHI